MIRKSTFGTLLLTALLGAMVIGCQIGETSGPASNHNDGPGGSTDTTKKKVILSLSPHSASLKVGKTAFFIATVTGAADTTVTWSVTPSGGTISTNGFYTAPSSIASSPMTVTIIAKANADSTARDTAVVTLTQDTTQASTGICFEKQILPIFQNNCALSGCHDPITHEENYNFSNYAGIRRAVSPGNPNNSTAYRQITAKASSEDRMPPAPMSPLPADVIATIKQWITEGALNTSCDATSCDTTNVTFSSTVKPILQANCLGCHTGSTDYNTHVPLDTYSGVQTVALDGRLYSSISHTGYVVPMPYGGGMLQDCDINQIKAWIDKGALNN